MTGQQIVSANPDFLSKKLGLLGYWNLILFLIFNLDCLRPLTQPYLGTIPQFLGAAIINKLKSI